MGLRWETHVAQDGSVAIFGYSGKRLVEVIGLRGPIWPNLASKEDPMAKVADG